MIDPSHKLFNLLHVKMGISYNCEIIFQYYTVIHKSSLWYFYFANFLTMIDVLFFICVCLFVATEYCYGIHSTQVVDCVSVKLPASGKM